MSFRRLCKAVIALDCDVSELATQVAELRAIVDRLSQMVNHSTTETSVDNSHESDTNPQLIPQYGDSAAYPPVWRIDDMRGDRNG